MAGSNICDGNLQGKNFCFGRGLKSLKSISQKDRFKQNSISNTCQKEKENRENRETRPYRFNNSKRKSVLRIFRGPVCCYSLPHINFVSPKSIKGFHFILIFNGDNKGTEKELCPEMMEFEILWISALETCFTVSENVFSGSFVAPKAVKFL